jgi:ABC-2 type transport system permease protein
MFPIFLAILVMAGIGTYAVMFAYELAPLNLTHVVLTMYILFTVVITLIEAIYKTQGILFDAKDNDLLFSMPIKRTIIFTSRLIKLLAFQYIFDLIIMLCIMIPLSLILGYIENILIFKIHRKIDEKFKKEK